MALQWLTLVASIWLQAVNGTNSNFPAYSTELKKILNMSQLHLNNIASASDAGKLFGWISGLAAAHLPLWLVLLIGSLLGLVGYGLQYLFLTDQLPFHLSYTHIFVLTLLAGNSICWINTVCYIMAIKNFPLDRQIAVGLSTSYVGLSAKLYTDVVDVLADPSSSSERAKMFLLLNSVLPLLVCLVVSPLARDAVSGKTRRLAGGFCTMFVITVFTGLYAVITSLGSRMTMFVRIPPLVVLSGMVVFLFLQLVTPVVEKLRERVQQKCLIRVYDEGRLTSTCSNIAYCGEKGINGVSDNNNVGEVSGRRDDEIVEFGEIHEEIGPKLMLRRVEFWLYFFVYLFGATLGLVYLNNLGQIAESRGSSGTSSLVSLSSAFGFFGRLLPSLIDYLFSKRKCTISRAAAMGGMMVPMCGAFFLLIIDQDLSLYISTAIIGICTGAITSISVSTTTELFGAKNFGVNHNILVSNIPVGSFVLGDFAALLYNRKRVPGEKSCMGDRCYQTTFILWGCLCCFGTFLAFALHARTRRLYSHNGARV